MSTDPTEAERREFKRELRLEISASYEQPETLQPIYDHAIFDRPEIRELAEKAHDIGMEMKRLGVLDIGPITDRDHATKTIADLMRKVDQLKINIRNLVKQQKQP